MTGTPRCASGGEFFCRGASQLFRALAFMRNRAYIAASLASASQTGSQHAAVRDIVDIDVGESIFPDRSSLAPGLTDRLI